MFVCTCGATHLSAVCFGVLSFRIEDTHGFFCTEILFFINTYCSWTYLRLYVFPVYVIYYGSFLGYFGSCVDYGEGLLAKRVPKAADRIALPDWNEGVQGVGPSTVFRTHIFADAPDGRWAARLGGGLPRGRRQRGLRAGPHGRLRGR